MVNKFLYPRGGAETYIFRVGEELQRLGHEVQYFGTYDERNIVGNRLGLYPKQMDMRSHSLETLSYPFRVIHSKEAKEKIQKVLEDFKPDIVHLNNIHFHLTPSIIEACQEENVPVYWTVHDFQLMCPNHLLYHHNHVCTLCLDEDYKHCITGRCIHDSLPKSVIGAIEAYHYRKKKLYNYVSMYICPSRFMTDKVVNFLRNRMLAEIGTKANIYDYYEIEQKISGKRIVFLQNFLEKINYEDTVKEDYVLFFGRVAEEKGIEQLVSAAKSLPNVRFKVAGNGPEVYRLKNIPNIECVGFKTGEELYRLISRAEFVLYPSVWYENCPLSIMEALSLKVPVITYNAGGMAELVENDVTGYTVNNQKELVERIKTLHESKEIRDRMSESCGNVSFHDLTEYTKELVKLYESGKAKS